MEKCLVHLWMESSPGYQANLELLLKTRICRFSAALFSPTFEQILLYSQLVEYPRHNKVHQIINGLRLMVKARTGWADDRAHLAELEHIFQMNGRVGAF